MKQRKVTNGYSVSSQLRAGFDMEDPTKKLSLQDCKEACYRNALREQGYEGILHTSLPEHLIAPFLNSFESCAKVCDHQWDAFDWSNKRNPHDGSAP